jgi:hypothetical protein
MSKSPKARLDRRQGAVAPPGRRLPLLALVFLVVAAAVAVGLWLNRSPSPLPPDATAPAEAGSSHTPAVAAAPGARPGLQTLVGRWLRPDGGYVLEISGVATNGALQAAYFNPKPIHVARAEASQDATSTRVFVELRDVNYPGSTYTLAYDPASDQLRGIYYQAVERQQFEVYFERMK